MSCPFTNEKKIIGFCLVCHATRVALFATSSRTKALILVTRGDSGIRIVGLKVQQHEKKKREERKKRRKKNKDWLD